MNAFRNRRQQFALWLALAAVFYRALIPVGFMPATAQQVRDGAVLVLCSGGLFKADAREPGKPTTHAYSECAYAVAAAPALPSAGLTTPVFTAAYAISAGHALPAAPAPQLRLPPARGPPSIS